jgi:hypothetical protein
MKNKKYADLINKDIDKIISIEEKEALMKFLGENPDAENLYKELHETNELLNNLTDREPSEDLKEKILNVIDFNLYKVRKEKMSFFEIIENFISQVKTRWSFSFSLGLAAGIVLLFIALSLTDIFKSSGEEYVYGTIGISSAELINSIDVETEDISGKIDLVKGSGSNNKKHFIFNIDIKSATTFLFQMQYDPENMRIENLSSESLAPVNFENKEGELRVSVSGNKRFSIITSPANAASENIKVSIIKDNESIFSKSIVIR